MPKNSAILQCLRFATPALAGLPLLFGLASANDFRQLSPDWETTALIGRVSGVGDVNGDGFSDVVGILPANQLGIFLGSADGPGVDPDQYVTVTGPSGLASIGVVSPAGDVNGDGRNDVLIGDASYGFVYLYLGSANGLESSPAWSFQSPDAGAWYGYAASTVGDVNGDYCDDFMVSETVSGGTQRVLLFLGSTGQLPVAPAATFSGSIVLGSFGPAGDVNGDGIDDFVVANPSRLIPGWGVVGEINVYFGAKSHPPQGGFSLTPTQNGVSMRPSAWMVGDVNGDGFADVGVIQRYRDYGYDVVSIYPGSNSGGGSASPLSVIRVDGCTEVFCRTAGDVNGDQFADLFIGCSGSPVPSGSLYYGGASPPYVTNGGQILLPDFPDFTDTPYSPAGDVNGDGLGDILVGKGRNHPNVSLYFGTARPPASNPNLERSSVYPSGGTAGIEASAGDVNGDGYEDILVGTPLYSDGQINEGRTVVYLGGPGGLETSPSWAYESNQPYALFGSSGCAAGDVNGDGYDDVVVGAYNHSNNVYLEGSIFVFFGSPAGLGNSPQVVSGGQLGAAFGFAVASAGDVDNDGLADLAVGAYAFDGVDSNEGGVMIYRGGPTGLGLVPLQVLTGGEANAGFGYSIAYVGDANGDGESDLLVGAPFSSASALEGGRAYLFTGNGNGCEPIPGWASGYAQSHAHFGLAVCGLGDATGDALADWVVAAPNAGGSGIERGVAQLFAGSNAGFSVSPVGSLEGSVDHARLGEAVLGPGDLNLDGRSDIVVFEPGGAPGCTAAAHLCGPGGVDPNVFWQATITGNYPVQIGATGPTDLNGDGFGDIVIPSPGATDGLKVYFGTGATAGSYCSQAKGVAGPLVPDFGLSAGPNYFQVRAELRSAAGRTRMRLETEAETFQQPFQGMHRQLSGWKLTSIPNVGQGSVAGFSEVAAGVPIDSKLKWRARARSRSPFFPTTPWRSRPRTGLAGWTIRTSCGGCISEVGMGAAPGTDKKGIALASPPVIRAGEAIEISIWSDQSGNGVLDLVDVLGRRVYGSDPKPLSAGWQGASVGRSALPRSSGVYFIRLTTEWGSESRRVLLVK